MVRQDILSGLSSAIARGDSLRQAMISFYNAGYKKEEIEEAAKALNQPQQQVQTQPSTSQNPQSSQPPQKIQTIPQTTQQVQPQVQQAFPSQSAKQNVSAYGKKKKSGGIIFLVVLLFVLVGALVSILVFREQLTTLINGLF